VFTAILLPLVSGAFIVVMMMSAQPMDMGWAWFGIILLAYFLFQLAYTFFLKNVVLVDVFALAAGHIFRAVAGAAVLLVNITPWWLLSLFFLALFLGIGKRRNELEILAENAGNHRRILQEYSTQYLDYMLLIDIACTIVVYGLATFTAPLGAHMTYPLLMLTVPFVTFLLFRYLYLIVVKGEGGEPADLILHDRPLLVTLASWGFLVLLIQVIRF
jgi:4-hydroxybenzoate polyprenyltransferase